MNSEREQNTNPSVASSRIVGPTLIAGLAAEQLD
jgi:hypothetical protein